MGDARWPKVREGAMSDHTVQTRPGALELTPPSCESSSGARGTSLHAQSGPGGMWPPGSAHILSVTHNEAYIT
jgi:hypothetical protein